MIRRLAFLGFILGATLFGATPAGTVDWPCDRIEAFGGVGDNSTPNDTAFTKWKATLGVGQACLAFGKGVFLFNSQAAVSLPANVSATIRGQGVNATTALFLGAVGGFGITTNGGAVEVSNMSVLTNQPGAGSAVSVTDPACNSPPFNKFENLFVFAVSGYWNYQFYLDNVRQAQFSTINTYGDNPSPGTFHTVGIRLGGSATGPCYSVVHGLTDVTLNNVHTGLQIDNYVQGVDAKWLNVTGGDNGILVNSPSTMGVQLVVANSQFNVGLDQIAINGDFGVVDVHDSLLYITSGHAGLVFNGSSTGGQYLAHHNNFSPATVGGAVGSGIGIAMLGGGIAAFDHNQFFYLATGISLQGGSNIRVDPNQYVGTTTPVLAASGALNVTNYDWTPAPTVSACGTSPSVGANSDGFAGSFTTGTGAPTSCSVAFATNYGVPNVQRCTLSPSNAAARGAAYSVASSLTGFTATFASGLTSASFDYVCRGK